MSAVGGEGSDRRRLPSRGGLFRGGLATGVATTLAAAVILTGVSVLGALAAPGSGAAGLTARILPIPDVAAYRALGALHAGPGAAPDYAAAAGAYRDELATAPLKSDAWAGLAYAESRRAGGRYSPATVAALAHGYDLAPFDGSLFTWRTHFALAGWDALTPQVRRAALDEMSAVGAARPDLRAGMRQEAQAMPSAEGRVAVLQALAALDPR